MARTGKQPVSLPGGVTVDISNRTVTVEGKLGKLHYTHRPEVEVVREGDQLLVRIVSNDSRATAFQGLARSLIKNMIEGVTKGYSKSLEVYGVGYGVNLSGQKLNLDCGKSHQEVLAIPAGIEVEIKTPQARGDTDPAKFTVKGCDKQLVGEFAAECRRMRPPEPYKGKGVRYAGEIVKRKVGKAFVGEE